MSTTQNLMNIEELSQRLGIPVATIYTNRTRHPDRVPPAIRFGKTLRWRPDDVDAWIKARRQEA